MLFSEVTVIIYSAYQIAWFFIIYAFFGWCLEVIYQAIEHGKFINRGFLNGPYCPIYGCGVIIVILLLHPIQHNILILYGGSVVLTTALEFITGFVLEKIFRQHWWDYSGERFNIKGYVCLKFSLLWGVACLVTVRLIHPPIESFVNKIPHTLGSVLLCVIYVGFVSDLIITVLAIMHIKNRVRLLDDISAEMRRISDRTGEKLFESVENVRDSRDEISQKNSELREKADELKKQSEQRSEELRAKYRELLENRSTVSRRIENTFPKLRLYSGKSFREQLDDLRKELQNRKNLK